MAEMTKCTQAWIELHALNEPPEAREWAVLEAQTKRVTAMLRADAGPSGSLFAVEPRAFASLLALLADESAP